mmetsp:Transcript_2542/g.7535  ORF Transcript_2542/g.7535 Transcript_2542/m.7535 type:complete len:214 (-) Transcript_2542:537-1178(-)
MADQTCEGAHAVREHVQSGGREKHQAAEDMQFLVLVDNLIEPECKWQEARKHLVKRPAHGQEEEGCPNERAKAAGAGKVDRQAEDLYDAWVHDEAHFQGIQVAEHKDDAKKDHLRHSGLAGAIDGGTVLGLSTGASSLCRGLACQRGKVLLEAAAEVRGVAKAFAQRRGGLAGAPAEVAHEVLQHGIRKVPEAEDLGAPAEQLLHVPRVIPGA